MLHILKSMETARVEPTRKPWLGTLSNTAVHTLRYLYDHVMLWILHGTPSNRSIRVMRLLNDLYLLTGLCQDGKVCMAPRDPTRHAKCRSRTERENSTIASAFAVHVLNSPRDIELVPSPEVGYLQSAQYFFLLFGYHIRLEAGLIATDGWTTYSRRTMRRMACLSSKWRCRLSEVNLPTSRWCEWSLMSMRQMCLRARQRQSNCRLVLSSMHDAGNGLKGAVTARVSALRPHWSGHEHSIDKAVRDKLYTESRGCKQYLSCDRLHSDRQYEKLENSQMSNARRQYCNVLWFAPGMLHRQILGANLLAAGSFGIVKVEPAGS
nr:hypothetical protein CFP56_32167 [Quercus suber]